MHNVLKEPSGNKNSNTTHTNNGNDDWTTIHSHVWKVGNSPHSSAFIDVSTQWEDELSIIQLAKQKFPHSMGVIPHHEGKHRVLLELAFDDEKDVERAFDL
ncbi:hypothetical protein INT45_007665 [Circinella minor]|uniref:Uncharacterized protein n=1 Tax=Circinella minor TaxID=1195481 RepID=A0A8H7RYQ5_9FUNG|nr:hypothetical protein INT45_007665 [Circinella minor]